MLSFPDGTDNSELKEVTRSMVSEEPTITQMAQFATELARRSGEKALSYYGKGKSHIKFDEGLVTEAELHITEFFRKSLQAQYPEHLLFQEAQDDTESTDYTRGESRYVWLYNPLDGVANFQAGIPVWGTSVALFDNFWPVFGVFYMPATDDLFNAAAGRKAFRGDQEICVSSQESINNESVLLTYSRFHQHFRTTFPGKIRNLGCTAAHICYVATGRAEAALIATESYEDVAAAWIIIEAAGGKIYKMDGTEFFFGKASGGKQSGEHLLVTSPRTYSQIRNTLEKI